MQNHHGEPERAKKDDGEAPTVDHVMGAPRRDHQQTRASERLFPFGTGSCFHNQHMAKSITSPPCVSKGSSFVHTGTTIALAVNLMIRRQKHQAPAKSGMDCCRQSRHGICVDSVGILLEDHKKGTRQAHVMIDTCMWQRHKRDEKSIRTQINFPPIASCANQLHCLSSTLLFRRVQHRERESRTVGEHKRR